MIYILILLIFLDFFLVKTLRDRDKKIKKLEYDVKCHTDYSLALNKEIDKYRNNNKKSQQEIISLASMIHNIPFMANEPTNKNLFN